jgi:hypothetical protein
MHALSRARARVCVLILFTSPPSLARTLCNGFRSKPQNRHRYQTERTSATALGLDPQPQTLNACTRLSELVPLVPLSVSCLSLSHAWTFGLIVIHE